MALWSQTPTIISLNASTVAAIAESGATSFATHDIAPVSRGARPYMGVAYAVDGVNGTSPDNVQTSYPVRVTLATVYQYTSVSRPCISRARHCASVTA